MRFYTNQHKFYCGIDLYARSMYVCSLSQDGEILLQPVNPHVRRLSVCAGTSQPLNSGECGKD